MKFTERALKVIKNADKEAEKTTGIVYPVHLLLGMLLERSGVCGELVLTYPSLGNRLRERAKEIYRSNDQQGITFEPFINKISLSAQKVLEIASNRMEHFNQIYINEGHLADAIFRSEDHSTQAIFDGVDVSGILKIVSTPRDMIVPLRDYSFPHIPTSKITFRKADHSDAASLSTYVNKEFGNRWLKSIEDGFLKEEIPIFIALDDHEIIGFACFDVVRNKKGLFGPMGTSLSKRVHGIGYSLLHFCLKEMNEIGYEYAVIGQAGPIEFYEKACNAVVIPYSKKSTHEGERK